MKNISQADYLSLHDQMMKARRGNNHKEEHKLLGELSDMWYVMTDADQDAVNGILKERAYQQRG